MKPQRFQPRPSRGAALLVVVFRFATGQHLDGKQRGDGTFWRDGTTADPHYWGLGGDPWWALLAGWKRAAIRWALVLLAVGLAVDRGVTVWALVLLASPLAGVLAVAGFRRWQAYGHYRAAIRPLAYALSPVLDQPVRGARSWLHVPADYATNQECEVVIDVPEDFTGADQDRKDIQRAVEAKLPEIESPDADWTRLHGHRPRVIFTHSPAPPDLVTWEEIRDAVYAASPDQFVVGIGKKGKIVTVSRTLDSPHLMINCGSGAGKSNLAAFLMLQAMIRGGWGYYLDAKLTSHPYVYKDMDAEFGQLPNTGYARRIPVMHDALLWLGDELARRYALTERYVNARGDMLGRTVGPPMFINAEEMNLSTPQLKDYWAQIRTKDDPKRSPALTAFGALAFAGRAADMHLIVVGQQLTAETLGGSGALGGAIRQNIGIKMLARYDANAWKMQAGDVPMPPSPSVPGRVQVLAGGEMHETQVPFMLERADLRDLALAGQVVPMPLGIPGTGAPVSLPVPAELPHPQGAADQPMSLGRPTFRPPGTATLRELAAAGFYYSHEAAKQASKRDPDHPPAVGSDGAANLYEISAVTAWKQAKAQKVRALR